MICVQTFFFLRYYRRGSLAWPAIKAGSGSDDAVHSCHWMSCHERPQFFSSRVVLCYLLAWRPLLKRGLTRGGRDVSFRILAEDTGYLRIIVFLKRYILTTSHFLRVKASLSPGMIIFSAFFLPSHSSCRLIHSPVGIHHWD